jgi:hypothetical protein
MRTDEGTGCSAAAAARVQAVDGAGGCRHRARRRLRREQRPAGRWRIHACGVTRVDIERRRTAAEPVGGRSGQPRTAQRGRPSFRHRDGRAGISGCRGGRRRERLVREPTGTRARRRDAPRAGSCSHGIDRLAGSVGTRQLPGQWSDAVRPDRTRFHRRRRRPPPPPQLRRHPRPALAAADVAAGACRGAGRSGGGPAREERRRASARPYGHRQEPRRPGQDARPAR